MNSLPGIMQYVRIAVAALCWVLAGLPQPLQASSDDDFSEAPARGQGEQETEVGRLQKALQAAGENSPAAYPIYEKLRHIYTDHGHFAKSIDIAKRQLAVASGPVQRYGVLINLVALHGSLHQLAKARETFVELERVMATLRTSKRWAVKGDWWQAGLARAKASLESSAGHPDQAEQAWKACLNSANRALQADPDRESRAMFLLCNRGLLTAQIATGQLEAAGQTADQLRVAAERVLEVNKRSSLTIRVSQTLGRLAMEQGKLDTSKAIFSDAIDAIKDSGGAETSLRLASLYKQMALLEMLQENWPRALMWHEDRARLIEAMGRERGSVGKRYVEYAYTLLRLGRTAESVDMMRKLVSTRDRLYDESSLYYWEGKAFLGIALAAAKEREEALAILKVAVPRILDIAKGERSSSDAGVLRTARLSWLLDGYLSLLADYAAGALPGDRAAAMDEAFRMADLARGSTVQRALAASASRVNIGDPALAGLARQEQSLQHEIGTLAENIGDLISRGRTGEQDRIVADMRASLDTLRREHDKILSELERRFPDYAALLNPKPVDIAATRNALRPDEALVSVYVGSDRTLVWSVPARGEPAFAIAPLSRAELEHKAEALLGAMNPALSAARLPNYRFDIAHELYVKLLADVESGWGDAKELVVVSHGRLAQLPFAVLTAAPFQADAKPDYAEMANAPWLIKRIAISQLPTASSLPLLRAQSRARRSELPFIGFGDPVFAAASAPSRGKATRGAFIRRSPPGAADARSTAAPRDGEPGTHIDFRLLPPLPETAQEIKEIAQLLAANPARDVYLQRRASEAQVKQADLTPYRIVMFATHGLMGGEMPGLYQPALALSNPALSGDGEDGMLTMEEILRLKLRADWVVLSACNSAAAGGQSGESVSGLGRAFFFAGAQSLLVTNWAVETESARLLTTDVFRRQAADPKLSRTRALQQASLALMRQSAGGFSYAHPLFWAPYSLVGDGG